MTLAAIQHVSSPAPVVEPGPRGKLTVRDIQATVASFYGLTRADLISPTRLRRIARPRQIAMFLARQLTPKTAAAIGERFGGRDHSTVFQALARVEQLYRDDAEIRQEIEAIWRRLSR